MDLNNFLAECNKRYSKHGVTMVDISFWNDILDIRLMRPEGTPSKPGSIRVGIDSDIEGPITTMYAHCSYKLPVNEEQVFKDIDEWFKGSGDGASFRKSDWPEGDKYVN